MGNVKDLLNLVDFSADTDFESDDLIDDESDFSNGGEGFNLSNGSEGFSPTDEGFTTDDFSIDDDFTTEDFNLTTDDFNLTSEDFSLATDNLTSNTIEADFDKKSASLNAVNETNVSDLKIDEDFLNVDLTDNSFKSAEVSDVTVLDFDDMETPDDVEYPHIFVDGIETTEEFAFFSNRKYDSDVILPLYCKVDNLLAKVGDMACELNAFLELRFIHDYRVFICKDANSKKEVPLDDPEALIKFIKL